ncbi:MAG TPA: VTT domain-containing protein, partial [Anaerolineae bacterium]
MEPIMLLFDWMNQLDEQLHIVIYNYGSWTYLLLFAIISFETGLVVASFLPSDSVLFTAGALAATGSMHPVWLFVLLTTAAVMGDSLNYWIGRHLGTWMVQRHVLNPKHVEQAASFLEKQGGKAIML